jgi:biotin transport system substrate-specific component
LKEKDMSRYEPSKYLTVRNLSLIALSVALLTVCSFIAIPTLSGYITLQLFAVLLIASTLDLKESFTAITLYVLLGLIGLPIFAGFRGGLIVLFEPSGGYLAGFILTSIIVPTSRKLFGNSTLCTLISSAVSIIISYVIASVWFLVLLGTQFSLEKFALTLALYSLPYIIPDLIKLALVLCIAPRVRKFIDFSIYKDVAS